MPEQPQTIHDVFRAATLSFLIACLYLLLSAAVDAVEIHALGLGDERYEPAVNFRLALATATLVAGLLCIWVLLVTAFARKYISRLSAGTTAITAFSISLPLVVVGRVLPLFDPQALWSPTVILLVSLLWSSVGLHALLWYLTTAPTSSSNET